MKCNQVIDLISEYVDGTLTVERAAEIEKHLGECEECSRVLISTKKMLLSLKSLSGNSAPKDCWAAVKAHAESRKPGFLFPAWWRPAFAGTTVTAAVVTALLLGGHADRQAEPVLSSEMGQLIGVHSRLEQQRSTNDQYVSFVAAELRRFDLSPVRHIR
jgi:anti-sigma factor RsiW